MLDLASTSSPSDVWSTSISLDKMSATALYFPSLSMKVKLKSYSSRIHLMILPLAIGLLIRYLMAAWFVYMNTLYPIM